MISRLFRHFASDSRGTATIELAIFAPVLATMVIGVVDMSMAYGRKLSIEQAAQRSIEKVMQTTGSSTPDETIISEAATQAPLQSTEESHAADSAAVRKCTPVSMAPLECSVSRR